MSASEVTSEDSGLLDGISPDQAFGAMPTCVMLDSDAVLAIKPKSEKVARTLAKSGGDQVFP